jgi:hypothetical protein
VLWLIALLVIGENFRKKPQKKQRATTQTLYEVDGAVAIIFKQALQHMGKKSLIIRKLQNILYGFEQAM